MYGFDHVTWMFGGWIVMLLFWLMPFAALFVAIRFLLDKYKAPVGKTALDLLEEAYADGKISREEFLQKRDDIRSK